MCPSRLASSAGQDVSKAIPWSSLASVDQETWRLGESEPTIFSGKSWYKKKIQMELFFCPRLWMASRFLAKAMAARMMPTPSRPIMPKRARVCLSLIKTQRGQEFTLVSNQNQPFQRPLTCSTSLDVEGHPRSHQTPLTPSPSFMKLHPLLLP